MNPNTCPSVRALPPPPAGEYDPGYANLYLRTDEWVRPSDGAVFVFVTLTIDGPDTSYTVSPLLSRPGIPVL